MAKPSRAQGIQVPGQCNPDPRVPSTQRTRHPPFVASSEAIRSPPCRRKSRTVALIYSFLFPSLDLSCSLIDTLSYLRSPVRRQVPCQLPLCTQNGVRSRAGRQVAGACQTTLSQRRHCSAIFFSALPHPCGSTVPARGSRVLGFHVTLEDFCVVLIAPKTRLSLRRIVQLGKNCEKQGSVAA